MSYQIFFTTTAKQEKELFTKISKAKEQNSLLDYVGVFKGSDSEMLYDEFEGKTR